MPAERLRDTNEGWGLTQAEYAHREKKKLRDRMRIRQQRANTKMIIPPMIYKQPVEKLRTFRLKGQDVQELGIIAVVSSMVKRTNPISRYREPILVPMSLPYVTLLHGSVR